MICDNIQKYINYNAFMKKNKIVYVSMILIFQLSFPFKIFTPPQSLHLKNKIYNLKNI